MFNKMKQELNTSCRIIDKDGSFKEYKTIEAASKATGLSIASIKVRCNTGSLGKDKRKCEWLDEYTKHALQAKRSRRKGGSWERDIIKCLANIGYTECVRSAAESKTKDFNKIDIVDKSGKLPINIQAKNMKNTPNYFDIRDACTDKTKPMVVLWKKAAGNGQNSPGGIAMVDMDFFFELLSCYKHAK